MENQDIWLMYHKAGLNEYSPMNIDGSEYIIGVAVIPAKNKEEANSKFEEFLSSDDMTLIELTNCTTYDPEEFLDNTLANKQINLTAIKASESGNIYYACGKTSEALAYNEEMDNK